MCAIETYRCTPIICKIVYDFIINFFDTHTQHSYLNFYSSYYLYKSIYIWILMILLYLMYFEKIIRFT